MITERDRRTLMDDFLEGCHLDFSGLWELPWGARELLKIEDQDEVRELSLSIILELLNKELIVFGDLDEETASLEPWTSTPAETVERIDREWRRLGRSPSHYEIGWATTTTLGDAWIEENR